MITNVNDGLKVNDVVVTKCQYSWASTIMGETYIVKYLCNGAAAIEDSKGKVHFNKTDNLEYIGYVKECIQYTDKRIRLIKRC